MEQIRVATYQADIIWGDVEENLAAYEAVLEEMPKVDILLLPEMFTTGFNMDAEALAEEMDGKTMQWLKAYSKMYEVVLVATLIIKEDNKFFNRLVWVQPDGKYYTYDKKHLFAMAGEHEVYTAGTDRLVLSWKGWKFCPLICYDLRFPAWARNTEDFDVLIYLANWPEKRVEHWKTLLKARAIENQCYTIGVNRCGVDGNGFNYTGDSSVFSAQGELIYLGVNGAALMIHTLSKLHINETRKKLPFLADRSLKDIPMA